jgi:putative transcriptional regulator
MPTVRRTRKEIEESFDLERFDWSRVDGATDEEIDRMIAEDPDTAPDMSDADLTRARLVVPPGYVDVKAIRTKLGLSQTAFAGRYGFRVRTVQEWEQGRRRPEGPARILLKIIERAPRAVERALADLASG